MGQDTHLAPRFASSHAKTERQVAKFFAAEFEGIDPALIVYFGAKCYDFAALAKHMSSQFPQAPCVGCTTAGELSASGYTDSSVVAIAFPAVSFAAHAVLIENLTKQSVSDCMRLVRNFANRPAWNDWKRQGILLVDGVSLQEDGLIAAIDSALHGMPVLGGSAGDGLDFRATSVALDGEVRVDSAVLVMLETNFQTQELIFDHFIPTQNRMVVTAADPARRLITEINAEPAAEEYAYLIGKTADQLTPFDFASNPLLVRAGDRFHVRSIQEITDGGALKLLSAIEQGVVMTLGHAQDIVAALEGELAQLPRHPDLILSFDCILRRLDAERLGKTETVSEIFAKHNMVGFNTYGEQHHGMHVNQTFVGVAFFAPETS